MKIAREILVEALRKIESTDDTEGTEDIGLTTESSEFLMNTLQRIHQENPNIAEFINVMLIGWKEDPPTDLDTQLGTIFTALVLLVDMFERQEEVNKLERQFGKLGG